MTSLRIAPGRDDPTALAALAALHIETVEHGGSVSFMYPLAPGDAKLFWRQALAAAERGERIVLCAWDGDTLAGTVTLVLDMPANQPHRAEIAKLMTAVSHRRKGVATALMRAAEHYAIERGRTLLTLDTATEDGAGGFYERIGFTPAGVIPNYALKPHGGLTGTMFYWKCLAARPKPSD